MRSIALLFLFLSAKVSAFVIDKVEVDCTKQSNCDSVREVFKSTARKYSDVNHFYDVLKLYVANEGIREFDFSVESVGEKNILKIKLDLKNVIGSIEGPNIIGGYNVEFPSILPIKEGEYLDSSKLYNTTKLLREIARDKGFPAVKVSIRTRSEKGESTVTIDVKLGRPTVVQDIVISSKSKRLEELIMEKIGYNITKPFDPQKMKNEIEDVRKLLLQYGYYLASFNFNNRVTSKTGVTVYLDVVNPFSYSFHLKGNRYFDEENLKDYLKGQVVSLKRRLGQDTVRQFLEEYYANTGYRNATFKVSSQSSQNAFGDKNTHFLIEITEYTRTFFKDISFKGNNFFKDKELRQLFFLDAPENISIKTLDADYLENFRDKLKELYIANGFVSVFVSNVEIIQDVRTGDVNLSYRIREGIQAKIDKLEIDGIPKDLENDLVFNLQNQQGNTFNPIAFKQDLQQIETTLKNEGYYFAKITNLNDSKLVRYKQDNSRVAIKIEVLSGKKLFVENVLIIGNKKTRKRLIEREIVFKRGDLLTRQSIERSQTNLLALGLFSSVQIKPVGGEQKNTDIIIFVREKDFGVIELAPGVRTDIGLKMSTTVNYNNLDGMNKKISFRGTVNNRFDLNALDENRQDTASSLVEYDATINYSEDHIFYSDYDLGLILNTSRRRFFSFDADIQRISYTISRRFTRWFDASIRQQFETISQFDATQERDDGFFQIGSFTPSMTFDFRDRSINPTRGAFFDLAVEFANPFFGAQQNSDLTIDYYKLTSRNRFYLPISQNLVVATSTTFGIQENRARGLKSNGEKEGLIPGIKVFRLIGADIIRGYEDDEMNRLISGEDISAVAVDRRAYMFNLKFEPRYYLSDSTILGVFYDAGRIFLNEFVMGELRSSVGLSFKVLTPVGTLDVDYGIKTLRKRDANGNLENPGRLHISIGFF